MINITRSYPAPASLESEKIKKSGTCRQDDVLEQLKTDFKNKCYLCETKGPDPKGKLRKYSREDNVTIFKRDRFMALFVRKG